MKGLFNILVVLLTLSLTAYAKPPANIDCAKLAIVKYYESGQYDKDVKLALQKATSLLQKKIAENKQLKQPQQLAIVFDIDDTSLSTYTWYKRRDFQRDDAAILASYQNDTYPVIKAVRSFYDLALQNKVKLFFISARPAAYRQETINNLEKAGYYHWSGLFLVKTKSIKREELTKQGYHIVLNIGDKESDFKGGFADNNIKIPNPIY